MRIIQNINRRVGVKKGEELVCKGIRNKLQLSNNVVRNLNLGNRTAIPFKLRSMLPKMLQLNPQIIIRSFQSIQPVGLKINFN
jgi:hypothetical protein